MNVLLRVVAHWSQMSGSLYCNPIVWISVHLLKMDLMLSLDGRFEGGDRLHTLHILCKISIYKFEVHAVCH